MRMRMMIITMTVMFSCLRGVMKIMTITMTVVLRCLRGEMEMMMLMEVQQVQCMVALRQGRMSRFYKMSLLTREDRVGVICGHVGPVVLMCAGSQRLLSRQTWLKTVWCPRHARSKEVI